MFEIGRVVPVKPRTVKRQDGSTYTIATKRVVEDGDIGALLRAVMAWLEPLDVDRAVLERAIHFRTSDPVTGAGGARAAGLARAQWIGGEIAGTLRAALYDPETPGERVQTVASASWRAVARKGVEKAETSGDKVPYLWREGVRRAFGASWPAGLGEHEIDAGGCILWAVRREETPAPRPRAPRKERTERPKPTEEQMDRFRAWAAERQAEQSAERARARRKREKKGCFCHARHVRDCPLFKPMCYPAAKARGLKGARPVTERFLWDAN